MPLAVRGTVVLIALALGACAGPRDSAPGPPPVGPQKRAGFVNRVWSVQQSNAVTAGTLYVFLSDGTLLITSDTSTPMVGSWRSTPDGLTMVEEGIEYRVDILGLTAREFSIRSHNPGAPVDITLVPADVQAP